MRISDWSSDVCSSDLNLGGGNHAIVVYQVDDMQQTALLKLPRYEQPVGMHWASDTRLLVAKGRLIGSREKPLARSEEHTSELQSLMRISYAVFCLKNKNQNITTYIQTDHITNT